MTGKPAPCCPECDEPLTWCIHGSGEAWDDHPAPRIGMKKDTAEEPGCCLACSNLDCGPCSCREDCGHLCCAGPWHDAPPEVLA